MLGGALLPTIGLDARRQLRGLLLVCLLCGQEVVVLSGTPRPRDFGSKSNVADPSRGVSDYELLRVAGGADKLGEVVDYVSNASARALDQVSAPPRRAVVVGVQFGSGTGDGKDLIIGLQGMPSNINGIAKSLVNVNVYAGIKYLEFNLYAVSGLGKDTTFIRAKLVQQDLRETGQICDDAQALMGAPFDGTNLQAGLDADTIFNAFRGVIFPVAGIFRLCYSADSVLWELLEPTITVLGSDTNTNRVWCVKTLFDREICNAADQSAKPPGCECTAQIEGFKVHNITKAVVPLGITNPPYPVWRLQVGDYAADCGTRMANIGFSKFRASDVRYFTGYEVHNLGIYMTGQKTMTWKLCYCVGYDDDNGVGTGGRVTQCSSLTPEDFAQSVGLLNAIDVVTVFGGSTIITVQPVLPFHLQLQCGYNPGGCSTSKGARYRIVSRPWACEAWGAACQVDLPYYESAAGCRFLPQATTQSDGSTVWGGHLSPDNCGGPTSCTDQPEIVGPLTPTWFNIKLDASYQNLVMIPAVFDVCYCDSNCDNSMFWFKAGLIRVPPVRTWISADGLSPIIAPLNPVVGTPYYITMDGGEAGPISGWAIDGAETREMKILLDDGGFVDKVRCLKDTQPDVITGHRLISGNTIYTPPSKSIIDSTSGRGKGQQWGEVSSADGQSKLGSIKFLQAGNFALCYCDGDCNEVGNWAVFGRVLIAGPTSNNRWVRFSQVSFDLEVKGYGFTDLNRLLILSYSNTLQDCGAQGKSSYINGPEARAKLVNYDNNPITAITWDPNGLELSFKNSPQLLEGDSIRLENVGVLGNDPLEPYQTAMVNKEHLVHVKCDSVATSCYKIRIDVVFSFAEFPNFREPDSVRWYRSSRQTFKDINAFNPSPDGSGYPVCWSPELPQNKDFVGQAGYITVKDPPLMPSAGLGLTTVLPNQFQPVMVAFTTNDIAAYSQISGPMSLRITIQPGQRDRTRPQWETTLDWKTFNGDVLDDQKKTGNVDWDTAKQSFCGMIFLEMWSRDENGFPQPDGCFYKLDQTNPDIVASTTAAGVESVEIKFSRKNGLKANTDYVLVFNAIVYSGMARDFPQDGTISVLSMDDHDTNPFGVLERGQARPGPQEKTRVPPRNPAGQLMLREPGGIQPTLEVFGGFTLIASDFGRYQELRGTCKANNIVRPDQTPSIDKQCRPCRTELDCGNTGTEYTWCTSPLDENCPNVFKDNFQSFKFSLKAQVGSPIVGTTVVRLTYFPLTQWDIGNACKITWGRTSDGEQECTAPGGGLCGEIFCTSEMVLGGPAVGPTKYPVNTMVFAMPQIMNPITNTVVHKFAVGTMKLPTYGFWPSAVACEITSIDGYYPDYRNPFSVPTGGAYLWMQPRLVTAALVVNPGDGNAKPFAGDTGNELYIKMVTGVTLFAYSQSQGIRWYLKLPQNKVNPNRGYICSSSNTLTETPELTLLAGLIPNGKGRFGGDSVKETRWSDIDSPEKACQIDFQDRMVVYARSVVYIKVRVSNPRDALKAADLTNVWTLSVYHKAWGMSTTPFILGAQNKVAGLGSSVSVLGMLTDLILMPTNYGAKQENWLQIFFTTQQEVGSMLNPAGQVWLDAPATFQFNQYCAVAILDETYYIPEASPQRNKLPIGAPPTCRGDVTQPSMTTYNRAKVTTIGRMLANTLYGFQLKVINSDFFVSVQLNQWKLWTYEVAGYGVDGAFNTMRFNPQVPVGENTSFGIYPLAMPLVNFQVAIEDLRPTLSGTPTVITISPIVVQQVMIKPLRIVAPQGYEWNFQHYDFRYKAPAKNVDPSIVLEGVDADLPISGIPAMPISEPKNVIAIDFWQAPLQPGVKYGFAARIRVPPLPPTGSANQFSMEFGYQSTINADRLEGGIFKMPVVKRIINGVVSYTSNIVGQKTNIMFEFRTITSIPRAGGILITGPLDFVFNAACQPKPDIDYPEMPYDSTCLYRKDPLLSTPEIMIVAGVRGIPPRHYRFSFDVQNPMGAVSASDAGKWTVYSFSLLSERFMLDYYTSIPAFPTNNLMFSAALVMPPKKQCSFLSATQQLQYPNLPVTSCPSVNWQFYPPRGLRSDLPLDFSYLIITFQLEQPSNGDGVILVRAPFGYIFLGECTAVVDSARVFDDTVAPSSTPTAEFLMSYTPWPVQAALLSCQGKNNEARITVKMGLLRRIKYVFRVGPVQNPPLTPVNNFFTLEYRPLQPGLTGESSAPFKGVDIWCFNDALLQPTTTAASTRARATENDVTIWLRPTNDVPTQGVAGPVMPGMLRVEAPSGFLIRGPDTAIQNCQASIILNPDDMPNMSKYTIEEQIAVSQYTNIRSTDVTCQADETPSSRCRLVLRNSRYLKGGLLYKIVLRVWNPQTLNAQATPWLIRSYQDVNMDPSNLIDSVTLDGFPINDVVQSFAYMQPTSYNALEFQQLDFNISFPTTVEIGDTVEIIAPISYYFSVLGDSRCPQYVYLDGSLRRTQPICGANTMMWSLEDESVPRNTVVRFLVQIRNPPLTPTLNLFEVKQTGSDGTIKSSRMIPGYSIIPMFSDMQVNSFPPAGQSCRSEADVIDGRPCQAQGSTSAVQISFMPMVVAGAVGVSARVGEAPLDFSKALIRYGVPIVAISADHVVGAINIRPGTRASITIEGILLPLVSGDILWTVSAYSANVVPKLENRLSENKDFKSLKVYSYLQTLMSSTVSPIYYGAKAATVTFELRTLFDWTTHDVLVMTRPAGYLFIPGTLRTFRDFSVTENGLDMFGRFSTSAASNDPQDFYMVLGQDVLASTSVLFSVKVDLPLLAMPLTNWLFRTYTVGARYDSDGELLDSLPARYPWLERELTQYGTNDGAFVGFILVGSIPFTVTPEHRTPGANIKASINFQLPQEVQADSVLVLQVTAPSGFVFADSCLATGSAEFAKCAGFLNNAALQSTVPRLTGSDTTVHLTATNPGETPANNVWTLSLFKDGSSQYVNFFQIPGYDIASMKASFKGLNQLGETAPGYFTFTPVSNSPTPMIYMSIYPPAGQGFNLNCQAVQPLAFRNVDQCEALGLDKPLTLMFANSSILKDFSYTIGIGVSNPGGRPIPAMNIWGFLLMDNLKQVFDGNLRIAGLDLKSIPVECGLLGWTSAAPQSLATISIQMRVRYTLPPGAVKTMEIRAPLGIMFNEDPSTVKILPVSIPLSEAKPTQVLGDVLRFNFDQSKSISVGMYNIRFDVSNPSSYPADNTWTLALLKDVEVEFSMVFAGYSTGQESPLDVSTVSAIVGGAVRRSGERLLTALLPMAVLYVVYVTPVPRL